MENKFLGLRTCLYRVPDLAAATKWYTEILGIKPYFEEVFYVGFNVGGYELGLEPEEGDKRAGLGGVTCYGGVDHVAEHFAALLAAGAKPFEVPNDVGSGIIVATVLDPWGNAFGLIHNPHFKLPS